MVHPHRCFHLFYKFIDVLTNLYWQLSLLSYRFSASINFQFKGTSASMHLLFQCNPLHILEGQTTNCSIAPTDFAVWGRCTQYVFIIHISNVTSHHFKRWVQGGFADVLPWRHVISCQAPNLNLSVALISQNNCCEKYLMYVFGHFFTFLTLKNCHNPLFSVHNRTLELSD